MKGSLTVVFAAVVALAAAQEPDLVPRRLYVSAAAAAAPEGAPQLSGAAEEIYAAVAARVPVVRVADPAAAHARLAVSVDPQGDAYRLAASLRSADRPEVVREAVIARGAAGFSAYVEFLRETAAAFAPLLPLVRPQVVMGDVSQEARYRSVAEETDFVSRLARSWEITFWAGGLTEAYHEPMVERPDPIDIRTMPLLPLSLDAAWYYSRNGGLVGSLYFDYGDFAGLGILRSGEARIDKARSTNLFLLPGLGITYRTLARVSAQFAAVCYFGPVYVAARDAIAGIAAAGEETWTTYFMMTLSSALSWNITERFSVKMRVSVSTDMTAAFLSDFSSRDPYSPVTMQFFTLGAAWRP